MKKILVIKAHTREKSYCNALADKYIKGANVSNNEVEILNLRELPLELFLKFEHSENPELFDELIKAQEMVHRADHIVFVYPTWWATPPALLKVFFEIIFTTGFAFKYLESKGSFPKWEKLLKQKTARIISTMDSPPFYMNWFVGDPGGKMMKDIISFTGMKLSGKHYFGSVKTSSAEKREKWLEKAFKIGENEK